MSLLLAACLMLDPPATPLATRTGAALNEVGLSAASIARASRFDVARAYQRLEEACARYQDRDWDRVAVSDIMDQAAGAFLSGRIGPAIELLDQATLKIGTGVLPESWRLADGRSVRPARAVTVATEPTTVTLDVVDLAPDLPPGSLTLSVRTRTGTAVASHAVDLSELPLTLELTNLAPEAYIVEWTFGPSDASRTACSFVVSEVSLDEAREELLNRLEAKCGEPDTTCESARARFALLTDNPPGLSFAELRFDPLTRLEELREEVRLIEWGHDPYAARLGDTWRTFRSRAGAIPVRVYVPEQFFERRPGAGADIPLIVALHGAGGDENLWMDGYAAGAIRRLADERGFIVASPLAYPFLGDPGLLDDLIHDLSHRHGIDPRRVHVIGHSMGGVGASLLAQRRADVLASACAIAGAGNLDPASPCAPLLVFAAERDRIVPAARVKRACRAAIAAGLPIDLRDSPGLGHSLVVAVELEQAVDWLLSHQRGDRPSPSP